MSEYSLIVSILGNSIVCNIFLILDFKNNFIPIDRGGGSDFYEL